MAKAEANLNLRKLSDDITMKVNVTVTRELKIRIWLALKLVSLASWVLGCAVEIEENESE